MNSAVINIKTEPVTKREAQKVAKELGVSLSSLINGFLKNMVKTKVVVLSAREEPTPYLLKILRESREDIKKGRISPSFNNTKDAIAWLNDPKARYQNGDNI